MSEQNNNQQGNMQQGSQVGYQQGYMQQGSQPDYQQGYMQQGSQVDYQQGYMQQGSQVDYQQGYMQQDSQAGYQQGYMQQGSQAGYQQGYMQQGSQPGYQQGYMQQGSQTGYQQGYMQQGNQSGYRQQNVQQGYLQSSGGGTPQKKSKTGLVTGIVIGAVILIIGAVLLIFKDKIFGDNHRTTEEIYEPAETIDIGDTTAPYSGDEEGGFITPEEVNKNYWKAFSLCDKELMYQCFYLGNEGSAASAEASYENALDKAGIIVVDYSAIAVSHDVYDDIDKLQQAIEGRTVTDAKSFHCEVPMTQEINGQLVDILDIYDGFVYQLDDGKWYMGEMSETDVQILGNSSSSDSTVATEAPEGKINGRL